MGYYTNYKLKMDCNEATKKLIKYTMKQQEQDFYGILNEDSCKWYDHEDDMKKLSIAFPTVLFTLKGLGEENLDVWVKYFKNGKMQECYATVLFDEYDENKLK